MTTSVAADLDLDDLHLLLPALRVHACGAIVPKDGDDTEVRVAFDGFLNILAIEHVAECPMRVFATLPPYPD
jgi:hypothetical protein